MLAMTIDPNHNAGAGIYKRALASMDESLGRGKRDRAARRAKRNRVLQSLLRGDQIPDHGIYPGLGERWGRVRDDQIAFAIPVDHLRLFCEKIVRGITFLESGLFIEPPFCIDFYPMHEQDAGPIKALLDRYGAGYARGPGFEVMRIVPPDEPRSAMFRVTLFGQVVMYAAVSRQED